MRIYMSILIMLFLGAGSLWTDTGNDRHSESVEAVTAEIRAELGLKAGESIDPDKVPPQLLEELGDAVMGTMHPDPEQHEWMDKMMGGEGSESLAAAHRWMGSRYLSGGYGPGSPMMGGGMMGGGMMGGGMLGGGMLGRWGMMGNPDIPYGSLPHESPEEILKRRYAQGDISRREYFQMLEDLKETE
jgi:hypothetical protein